MNIINPIVIDIYNIRNERQKINNELAMKRIKERIFNKDINQTIYNKQDIAINFKTSKINDRWNKIYIEIPNINQKDQIQKITLKLSNEYNIDNMNVIEHFGNCYYVK